MGSLTYNLIVRASDHSSTNYWKKLQELARDHGIRGPVIIFNTHQVRFADLTDGPLDDTVLKGRPYGQIPQVVKDYEAAIEQTDTPRWAIVPPSEAERVRRGLINVGILRGSEYFSIEVGVIYDGNSNSGNRHQAMPSRKKRTNPFVDNGQAADRLAQLITDVRTREANPDKPSLVKLIRKVSVNLNI